MSAQANEQSKNHKKRRGLAIPALAAGGLGSVMLALSLNPTFSAYAAGIVNDHNTAGTGTLTMQETDASGNVVCTSTDGGSISSNSATCSTINKYGGNLSMVPGQASTTTVKIKNTGSIAANTFTLTPGAVTQAANGSANGSATDLGAKMKVVVTQDGVTKFNGSAASLAAGGAVTLAGPVAPGTTSVMTFTVTLDPTADNTYQGLQISQPLTWTFTA